LLKESEDVVLVLNSLALALRPGLATLAHMEFVTFAGKLLVRTFASKRTGTTFLHDPQEFSLVRFR
jgi:hypothetical protein